LKEIKKGEAITVSYVNAELSTRQRQLALAKGRFPQKGGGREGGWACMCERCVDPKEGGLETGTVGCPLCRRREGEGWGEEMCEKEGRKGGGGGGGRGRGGGGGGLFSPLRPVVGGGSARRRSESASDSKQKYQHQHQHQEEEEKDEDDPSRPLLAPFKSSSACLSYSSFSYYQCDECHATIPAADVLAIERRFEAELEKVSHQGKMEGGREGVLRTARQVDDYETLICLLSGRWLHPQHSLLQRARRFLFDGVCRMVDEAKERVGTAIQIEKEEEKEEEEKDMEGMEEGRRGCLKISSQKCSWRANERRERNERRRWEALLEWSEWDERLIALAPVIVSSIQATHQTLDEQSTALILGEWALAVHRQAYRRREDAREMLGGRGKIYGIEEGPHKRAMQEEAKRLLKKAEESLSSGQGAYFRRQIVMEREVREALNADDPAAEMLLMGGKTREIVMPASLTGPGNGNGQRLMYMANHPTNVVGRGQGCEVGAEGGNEKQKEEQLETLVQMALAGQEGRSHVISDMWTVATVKGRPKMKSKEAVGTAANVLKGRVGLEAAEAAAGGAATGATGTLRKRPAGKGKVE